MSLSLSLSLSDGFAVFRPSIWGRGVGTGLASEPRSEGFLRGIFERGADSFWDVFLLFFDFVFSLFVRASEMSWFTAFSREIGAFYTSPSTSPASFSTSPACPTKIPSITNNRG